MVFTELIPQLVELGFRDLEPQCMNAAHVVRVGKRGIRIDVAWDIDNQVLRFNHYKYTGKMDEIAVFDTFLTKADARYLHAPKLPLNVLLKKDR